MMNIFMEGAKNNFICQAFGKQFFPIHDTSEKKIDKNFFSPSRKESRSISTIRSTTHVPLEISIPFMSI